MSVPKPLFEAGERVRVVPGSLPCGEFEATVTDKEYGLFKSIYTLGVRRCWSYYVTPDAIDDGLPWGEEVLRKLPPPSADSFTEIMEKCRQGSREAVES